MSFSKKCSLFSVLFALVVFPYIASMFAQENGTAVPFLYPDPRTVGTIPYFMQGKPAVPVTNDRYAGISEQERMERMLRDQCLQEVHGLPGYEQPPCPLCAEKHKTPCGTCKMCEAGFPCEKTLCRHCVQPRSKNMMNSCDLTAGDEPCGTCDACREHRSDPCEHADSGYGPRGEFNPYREVALLSVIPRPVLDWHNNGARKFPVYYNPAPYYRPTWNPSTFAGYNRPFTFRWSCELCCKDPCECSIPGNAGQVSYAYTCKICKRNPCACTVDICNVNKPMDPQGIRTALAAMSGEKGGPQPQEIPDTAPGTPTPPGTPSPTSSPSSGTSVEGLFDDAAPVLEPSTQPMDSKPLIENQS